MENQEDAELRTNLSTRVGNLEQLSRCLESPWHIWLSSGFSQVDHVECWAPWPTWWLLGECARQTPP